MSNCPCGSEKPYTECCEPAHRGVTPSKTAEALMRSRYCAYVKGEIAYLGNSLHPDYRDDWSEKDTRHWSESSEWISLEIMNTEAGLEDDDEGLVEFTATFMEGRQKSCHHEISRFQKVDGLWYYVDGMTPKPVTFRNETPKVGRNDTCPCGSGKKYKKCCAKK